MGYNIIFFNKLLLKGFIYERGIFGEVIYIVSPLLIYNVNFYTEKRRKKWQNNIE